MKKDNDVYVRDLGGWNDVQMRFEPGWSTGPENGPYQNGVSFGMRFMKPFRVGGLFSHRKIGQWNGGGIIPKEKAIEIARAILNHYGEGPST